MTTTTVKIELTTATSKAPRGKLAEAELVFTTGDLKGWKLVGFTVWETSNGGRNVTMPARTYSVNGERHSYALLRPAIDTGTAGVREAILHAYDEAVDAARRAEQARLAKRPA